MSERLPRWLVPSARRRPELDRLGRTLAGMGLHTVCQSARCPNLGECFGRGHATFLILGDVCTRSCRFCAVDHGDPRPVDPAEPGRVAEAARMLKLRHIVITSVTRDDLPDGGAAQFAATIREVRRALPEATVEVLIPDLQGNWSSLEEVMAARPEVLNHNVETVARLYSEVRQHADYGRSLELLRRARLSGTEAVIKSGFMVGLGETREEIVGLLRDLRGAFVEAVTIGQYLRPSKQHLAVQEYLPPETFDAYAEIARGMGFQHVLSGPLVRSSYQAGKLVRVRLPGAE